MTGMDQGSKLGLGMQLHTGGRKKRVKDFTCYETSSSWSLRQLVSNDNGHNSWDNASDRLMAWTWRLRRQSSILFPGLLWHLLTETIVENVRSLSNTCRFIHYYYCCPSSWENCKKIQLNVLKLSIRIHDWWLTPDPSKSPIAHIIYSFSATLRKAD